MKITLKTLPDASLQEIFNQAATHLLTQNEKSELKGFDLDDSECRYRLGSLCCAVGVFIADDEYRPLFEGRGVVGIVKMYSPSWLVGLDSDLAPRAGGTPIMGPKLDLLKKFQVIHDNEEVHDWAVLISKLALDHNLNMVKFP